MGRGWSTKAGVPGAGAKAGQSWGKGSVCPYRPSQQHLGTSKDQALGTGRAFPQWVWAEGCGEASPSQGVWL